MILQTMINLLSKTTDFIKTNKFINKTYYFIEIMNSLIKQH